MSNETHPTYDLSNVLGLEGAAAIKPGTSLLVAGPSMTGKEALTYDLLADGLRRGEGAITVTTNDDGADSIDAVESRFPELDHERLSAIDCRADSGREDLELDSGSYLYRVAEPSDFTGIGIGITNSFQRLERMDVPRSRVALNTLSLMVTYSDRQTVFKFCHVLAERLDSAGFLGLFTFDTGVHDDQTQEVIKQAFDGVLQVRERDGNREARLRGLQPEPTEWTQL